MATVRNQRDIIAGGDGEPEINADILETVFSKLPLHDLVSASHVSRSWCHAVSSSLHHRSKRRSWLILHAQSTRSPYAATTHAYDPHSRVWIHVPRPPEIDRASSPIKSSHSSFLYALTLSRFSFSSDPLNFEWHQAVAPRVWRNDPVVARVGTSVVIAGGGCDFEDDPLAVEIYDLSTRAWRVCNSMPSSLRDSASSQWLSIAVTAEKLVVTDKESGLTHWFDPGTDSWSGSFHLNPGQPGVSIYNIAYIDCGLILIGFCTIKNSETIKIWRIAGVEFSEFEEIGEMPPEYVERLMNESFGNRSINVRAAGDTVYIYNDAWGVTEVVACEVDAGRGLSWWSVRNMVAREAMMTERMVLTCAGIGISELERVTVASQ